MRNYFRILYLLIVFTGITCLPVAAQNNLSLSGSATASSEEGANKADLAIDDKSESFWSSMPDDQQAWLVVRFPGATEVVGVTVDFSSEQEPNRDFLLQYLLNGEWRTIRKVENNTTHQVTIPLEKPLIVDRVRLAASDQKPMQIGELLLTGQQYKDTSAIEAPPILVNQSGYNLNRPKRFTAPGTKDGESFKVINAKNNRSEFSGEVRGGKGDFSAFNPHSRDEFRIQIGEKRSFPFRISPYWLERVSYRNMVDFMLDARHYVGNVKEIRPISFAWRDGDFFNWSMQSLVAMYLSNPSAYERMEIKGKYVSNQSYPESYRGLWGALLPFDKNTPDIVQLMHWDADVKISQQLDHEMQKAELAHFLYAWPYIKKWLPQQNFDRVYAYTRSVWEKSEVSDHSLSQYDKSPEHNLLSLKTQLGSTKGEMPPGFSVIPNLMMYEVSKRQNEANADTYFEAAYRQLEWMIRHLDWQDPMTTKGQRMSEHMTLRAFAYFYTQYPERAPAGLKEKVSHWAQIALSRSDNMWDFRKYEEAEWTPPDGMKPEIFWVFRLQLLQP